MPTRYGSTEIAAAYYGSTEVQAIYYGSTEVFAPFEDGSLDIESDALSVNGGSTVNLRVKLGARPRSDVTVALSETSSLISLGSSSLTFTRDNWDTYQSVVVTAAGNRQELSLASSDWVKFVRQGWTPSTPRPQIIAALTPGADRFLSLFFTFTSDQTNPDQIGLSLTAAATGTDPFAQEDLSTAFEDNGQVAITVSGTTYVFSLAGADSAEPYIWQPSNSADVSAFRTAIDSAIAGTLVIRDFEAGDATISLAASGPDEYSGVTGSATVTVG